MIIFCVCGDTAVPIAAVRYTDKCDVYCLSTICGTGTEVIEQWKKVTCCGKEVVEKPEIIDDYNRFMVVLMSEINILSTMQLVVKDWSGEDVASYPGSYLAKKKKTGERAWKNWSHASVCVSTNPYFYPPLGGFFSACIVEMEPCTGSNHAFINGHLTTIVVAQLQPFCKYINK